MLRTNLQFFLNTYDSLLTTTTPSQNHFKWLREINGLPFTIENDQQIQVLPSITTPNIIPYPFSTPTNTGSYTVNGTATMSLVGPVDGIAVNNFIIGANIPIGTTVLTINPSQYTFTVSSANATVGAVYSNNGQTFTVASTLIAGTALITTGSGDPIASGTLTLVSGTGDATITFSSVTELTTLTMSKAATGSATETITFYSPAAFIYVEADQQVSVIYNGGSPMVLNPFQVNGLTQPAVFFMAAPVYSITVTNLSTTAANVFLASMG
jgi:hypothetical protein